MAPQPHSQDQKRDKGWGKWRKKENKEGSWNQWKSSCVNERYCEYTLSSETGCQSAETGHPREARGLQERAVGGRGVWWEGRMISTANSLTPP